MSKNDALLQHALTSLAHGPRPIKSTLCDNCHKPTQWYGLTIDRFPSKAPERCYYCGTRFVAEPVRRKL